MSSKRKIYQLNSTYVNLVNLSNYNAVINSSNTMTSDSNLVSPVDMGDNGYLLQTDGIGNTSWVMPSSSSGPTGLQGITGFTGSIVITGIIGLQGNTGPSGQNGSIDITGSTGITGINGSIGPEGTSGFICNKYERMV